MGDSVGAEASSSRTAAASCAAESAIAALTLTCIACMPQIHHSLVEGNVIQCTSASTPDCTRFLTTLMCSAFRTPPPYTLHRNSVTTKISLHEKGCSRESNLGGRAMQSQQGTCQNRQRWPAHTAACKGGCRSSPTARRRRGRQRAALQHWGAGTITRTGYLDWHCRPRSQC